MACYHPLHGWRARVRTARGKRAVVFSVSQGYREFPVTVPCGQCVGCRLERARQWAVRCMHEASLYEVNCFITLTYSDKYLPAGGSLDRRAFPLFMKRLRKRFNRERIRYFHCGEYGAESLRPHYHACLFGFDFVDKSWWSTRGGFPVWRSPALESCWIFGNSEVGSVTAGSACYVARYVVKKAVGEDAWKAYAEIDRRTGEVVEREREYVTMSRRPGIGAAWFGRFGSEVYPSDGVVVSGKLRKPPRYYDQLLERVDAELLAEVKAARMRAVDPEEGTWERLEARESVALAGVNLNRGL